jgi:RimJ/RimL family protein N-acetyltransferase
MEIEGIEVRPFRADEWQAYRAIRLKALDTDPKFFSSSFEKERDNPDDFWQQRLAAGGVFGVFVKGQLIGMTGAYVDKADPSAAKFWGSWLEPAWRGKGLARKMYETRINWAKAQPGVKRILVSHRKSNAVSKRANQRWGFVFTHAAEAVWPGGQKETEFFYELKL